MPADIDDDGGLTAIWAQPQADPPHSSFSSAVRRNETTPSKRRRGSDGPIRRSRTDHDRWSDESGSHSRSRTVDGDVGTGSYWLSGRSTSRHPLGSTASLASSSSWTLDHDTRPRMKKMLAGRDSDSEEGERTSEAHTSLGQDREMLVIVHEVHPKDSLAGVALKYGIALAELRRANQLWTSDSIHLRNILYVPVDKTRHAKVLREALLVDPSAQSDPHDPFLDNPPQPHSKECTSSTETTDLPDIGRLTLRRVPASQLSYFPPPTHSSLAVPSSRVSATLPNGKPRTRSTLPVSFTRSTESTLQGVFDMFSSSLQATTNNFRAYSQSTSSFLGVPVRAPTTLASRLSLESNSGTPSSLSDDMEWEHEMDVVTSAKSSRRRNNHSSTSASMSTSRTTHAREASASLNDLHVGADPDWEGRDSVELESGPFAEPRTPTRRHRRNSSGRSNTNGSPSHPGAGTVTMGSRGRGRQRLVTAASYVGSEPTPESRGVSIVRTAQLQPSPGMQLPLRARRRTKSQES